MVSPLARIRSGLTGSGSASSSWAAVGAPVERGHVGQRQPVILVLVAGHDQGQRRSEPLDQLEQDRGIVGGVDE